mmetsp:Transcript_34159/g.82730  ORF Transcript_34159/g.82730 Transcript_34159/m.82730 type:complete len:191 (-) Transcript_34159:2520-3092(-)
MGTVSGLDSIRLRHSRALVACPIINTLTRDPTILVSNCIYFSHSIVYRVRDVEVSPRINCYIRWSIELSDACAAISASCGRMEWIRPVHPHSNNSIHFAVWLCTPYSVVRCVDDEENIVIPHHKSCRIKKMGFCRQPVTGSGVFSVLLPSEMRDVAIGGDAPDSVFDVGGGDVGVSFRVNGDESGLMKGC